MDKKKIRQKILESRKSLSNEMICLKSTNIFHKLKTLDLYKNAKNIMIYMDFRNEVKTHLIIKDLLSSNKNVILPISVPKTKEMILSKLLDPKEELTKGTYGILEPKKEYIRKVNKAILDLIIVPGVAFDREGYRIGYGGGYYDRFLDKLSKDIPSIGLAFDLQIIDQVPNDSFDYPVDFIITETQIFSCK
ncbi:5-formyltetrahydrofolate cyclo-ligase [Crassaminicella profunda]|uniref:5-formyltetrahydrofolate cyclo-ligase n=1 Tax=Crassaminicella profunda TaxID=1286698 RepID=UPI001CA6A423|nr:5-formyltetrahydrofolate cyclo-ligase [Crassaminicella profunda]QZY55788.1 5-formyltetrahydrofolate cyclo-ligase [Crassaminicella profunda]